ncbi:MAG: hypothetical protein JWQ72_413, partial [Polaromonas sp.]|nr:hypothetical protein [Polaromonas sp.]
APARRVGQSRDMVEKHGCDVFKLFISTKKLSLWTWAAYQSNYFLAHWLNR